MTNLFVILFVIGAILYGIFGYVFFSSSDRARFMLTLEVQTTDGTKTASSTIEVVRSRRPRILGKSGESVMQTDFEIFGYAPIVDLSPRGWVVVPLDELLGYGIYRSYNAPLENPLSSLPNRTVELTNRRLWIVGPDGISKRKRKVSSNLIGPEIIFSNMSNLVKQISEKTDGYVEGVKITIRPTDADLITKQPDPPSWLVTLKEMVARNPKFEIAVRAQLENGAK